MKSLDYRLFRKAMIAVLFFVSFSALAFSQERTITGRITDADTREPLIGVTIKLPDVAKGSISDVNGEYTINVPVSVNQLIFSYIGYETDTIPIGGRTVVNVSLSVKYEELDEVVVIGYGKIRKSDLTGPVGANDLLY